MMPKKHVPREALEKLYLGDVPFDAMARKFGVSPATVGSRLIEYGIPTRPRRKYKQVDEQLLVALYCDERMSSHAVARSLGCSHSLVLNRLKARGIKRRRSADYYRA